MSRVKGIKKSNKLCAIFACYMPYVTGCNFSSYKTKLSVILILQEILIKSNYKDFIFLMKIQLFSLIAACCLITPVSGMAETTSDFLPEAGAKSPYSPQDIPTTLKPMSDSLDTLLNKGFQIIATSGYANSGILFTLSFQKQHVLCVLTTPNSQSDQNVPTSRCWSLNVIAAAPSGK